MKTSRALKSSLGAGMALLWAVSCGALSLRNSSAELAVGEASPGESVALSASGKRLRVENSGSEAVNMEFKVVTPSLESCKDGWEPWPFPQDVRVEAARGAVKPGEAKEADLLVTVPKGFKPGDGQYQFDVLQTGRDAAGTPLTLKSRALLTVTGRPKGSAAVSYRERAGFLLAPKSAAGTEATVKVANTEDEELTVTITAAKEWDDGVRFAEGYVPVPNPRWLRYEPASQTIPAGAIGRFRVWIAVPREKRYEGRRFAFVAAVDAAASGRVTRRYFTLLAETKEQEDEKRAR